MELLISFVGDIMLGRDYNRENTFSDKLEFMEAKNFSSDSLKTVYGTTLDMLEKSDLVVGNLETAVTNHDVKDKKVFNYRVNPKYVDALKLNENTYLNIANNHILDYMETGMTDTIDSLKAAGIKFSGAGKNLEEARKPAIFEIKGVKIGIIGAADHYDRWSATSVATALESTLVATSGEKSGINYLDYNDYSEMLKHIRNVKKDVDLLILSIHWGGNYARNISTKYRQFGRKALNAGVDIIHGHSSHHVKCIKNYGDKIIMYGIGDFVNDYAVDPEFRGDLGMIVDVNYTRGEGEGVEEVNKLETRVVPTKIEDRQVNVNENQEEIDFVLKKIKEDCFYT